MPLEPREVDNLPGHYDQTALFESYGSSIFGYLRLHTRSLEDAEDLLLEVFIAALEHDNLAALAPGEQLAWLRRVAHNKLLNVLRQTYRRPQVALDSIVENILEEEGPEQLTLRREEQSQLQASLQKLPELQQHILQLRYGDGLRCAEIAVLLNKQEGAVRKLLSRSILFLRQVYQLYTANNIGNYLTITLDGKVIESAVIQSSIPGPFVISGDFTQQQVSAIVSVLKSSPLPIELNKLG